MTTPYTPGGEVAVRIDLTALAIGTRLATRDGRPARLLANDVRGIAPCVVAVDVGGAIEQLHNLYADGLISDGSEHPHDIVGAERPKRIQRKRVKGWQMPSGAIYCGRPGRHGNPHDWRDWRDNWPLHLDIGDRDRWCKEMAQDAFLEDCKDGVIKIDADAVRGHDLACWCGRHDPCHVDIILYFVITGRLPQSSPPPGMFNAAPSPAHPGARHDD